MTVTRSEERYYYYYYYAGDGMSQRVTHASG